MRTRSAEPAALPSTGPRARRRARRRARAVAVLAAPLLAGTLALTGCTGSSSGASSDGSYPAGGREDASGCGDRVRPATLVAAFPGFDVTTGNLAVAQESGGVCTVQAKDGTVLAGVSVKLVPQAALRTQFLEQVSGGSSSLPADLGAGSRYSEGNGRAALYLVVGSYTVQVEVSRPPAKGSFQDTAVAIGRDVVTYYTAHPAPDGATPSATAS